MSSKEFGAYSNRVSDSRKEYEAKRTAVTHEIGDFVLSLHPSWQTWEVRTKDGSPVPPGLSGRYTDLSAFRQQLATYESRKRVTVASGVSE